jgi:hypothetical protein
VRPYLEKPYHKKLAGGVAQGEGSKFKPQFCIKKKKKAVQTELEKLGFAQFFSNKPLSLSIP